MFLQPLSRLDGRPSGFPRCTSIVFPMLVLTLDLLHQCVLLTFISVPTGFPIGGLARHLLVVALCTCRQWLSSLESTVACPVHLSASVAQQGVGHRRSNNGCTFGHTWPFPLFCRAPSYFQDHSLSPRLILPCIHHIVSSLRIALCQCHQLGYGLIPLANFFGLEVGLPHVFALLSRRDNVCSTSGP